MKKNKPTLGQVYFIYGGEYCYIATIMLNDTYLMLMLPTIKAC